MYTSCVTLRRDVSVVPRMMRCSCGSIASAPGLKVNVTQMRAIAGSDEVYGVKRLKQRLQERYGDHVMFAEMQGRKNVLCFRNMANYIINDKWYSDRNDDAANDAYRIIDAAAKVIREEVREKSFSKDEYPSVGDITDIDKGRDCLTPSLNALLARLIPSNCMKQVSIGQAIIQAMRPKTAMTPIWIGC